MTKPANLTDLTEFLRELAPHSPITGQLLREAADEIEHLRAEVAGLREDAERARAALVRARDGYISQRATGLPCQSGWLHATLGMLDAALAARKAAP